MTKNKNLPIGKEFPSILSEEKFEQYLGELLKNELTEIRKVRIVNDLILHYAESLEQNELLKKEYLKTLREHEELMTLNDRLNEVLDSNQEAIRQNTNEVLDKIIKKQNKNLSIEQFEQNI